MKPKYHQHMLIKAHLSNPPSDERLIEQWLTDLVAAINMKVVIPARAKYVTAEGNEGPTASINIETSHIALHIWNKWEQPTIQMDVYSCDCFEASKVLEFLAQWGLLKYEYMMLDRNDGFTITDHVKGLHLAEDVG